MYGSGASLTAGSTRYGARSTNAGSSYGDGASEGCDAGVPFAGASTPDTNTESTKAHPRTIKV
jgi:hypothetical protein